MRRQFLALAMVAFLALAGQCWGGITVVGTLNGQDGWSGGGPGDSSGFTNNAAQPADSNADLFWEGEWHGEAVTTADAHSGSQSWLFRRGYDSPGQATPFSPGLSVNAGQPSSGAGADTFFASFWFKAADVTGDDSRIMIAGGNPTGTDRSSNYLEIENTDSGVTVRTYDGVNGGGWGTTELLVATGLSSSEWHFVEMLGQFNDGSYNDTWTYGVDGGAPVVGGAYFETARDNFNYGYEMTNRLKFQPRHENWNVAYSGFYFDDIVTTVSASGVLLDSYSTDFEASTTAVPEPSTFVGLIMGVMGLALYGWRRRRRSV